MPIEINYSEKIVFNGKEYKSAEEMIPKERELYEKAMQALKGKSPNAVIKKDNKFVFNGREYFSIDEMPEDAQRIFKQAVAKMSNAGNKMPGASGLFGAKSKLLEFNKDGKSEFSIKANLSKRWGDLWNLPLLLSLGLIVGFVTLLRSGKLFDPIFLKKYSNLLWLCLIPVIYIVGSIIKDRTHKSCSHCGYTFSSREAYKATEICPRCSRSL
jgi:hypothetical protein